MTASRVRANLPATTDEQTVTVLRKGTAEHHFAQRPTDEEIRLACANAYGTNNRVILRVTLRSGQERTIQIAEFGMNHGRRTFKGVMANGNELLLVDGSLFGEQGGWVRLGDAL
jgi:hypothetical protein